MNLKIQNLRLTSPSELFKTPGDSSGINHALQHGNQDLAGRYPSLTDTKLQSIKNDTIGLSPIFNPKSSITVPTKVLPVLANISFISSGTTLSGIPSRPANSISGSEFIESTKGMNRTQREQVILSEILKGNIPDFVRQMKEVQVSSIGKDGQKHTGTIEVLPDYLAIGSNQDFVRIPMNPLTAQKIADQTGTLLPTRKIVDEIYNQATVKLTPRPLPAGPEMMSNDYYKRHNQYITEQKLEKKAEPGQLTAGQKKDIVITNMLDQISGRVAIYGWHQPGGKPIQPLSTVHENTYADYSHGLRLVNGTMVVDGVKRKMADILHDPNLAGLISDEGVIHSTRIKI